jgi:hypothetical protein
MIRGAPDSGWRTTALAVALFAITLNFLQPIAHAALLRDGAPGALWTVFCNSTAAEPGHGSGSAPTHGAATHECCLGLAHAQALIDPSQTFLAMVFATAVMLPLPAAERPTPLGIRDGPHRPRGPPSLA